MITILGTQFLATASGGTLTIPSGTTAVVLQMIGWPDDLGSVSDVASATIDGQAMTRVQLGAPYEVNGVCLAYLLDPPTGTQALVLTYSSLPWADYGPVISITYLSGTEISVRDAGVARDGDSVVIDSEATDFVLAFVGHDGGDPTAPSGTTSIAVTTNNFQGGRIITVDTPTSPTTTLSYTEGDFPVASMISLVEGETPTEKPLKIFIAGSSVINGRIGMDVWSDYAAGRELGLADVRDDCVVVNTAEDGSTFQDAIAAYSSQILAAFDPTKRNIIILYEGNNASWGGGPTVPVGDSPEEMIEDVESYCLTAQGDGFEVLVCTTCPVDYEPEEPPLNELDDLIRASTVPDGVIDLDSIADFYPPGWPGNEHYVDDVHIGDTGQIIITAFISSFLDSYLSGADHEFEATGQESASEQASGALSQGYQFAAAPQQSSTEQSSASLTQTHVLTATGQESATEQSSAQLSQQSALTATGQESTTEQASASISLRYALSVIGQESSTEQDSASLAQRHGLVAAGQESATEQALGAISVHHGLSALGQDSASEQDEAAFFGAVQFSGIGQESATEQTFAPLDIDTFDPVQVAGIIADWDVDDVIDSSGASSLPDRSGNGNDLPQATAGARPAVVHGDADFNGHKSLQGATGDYLRRATFTGGLLAQPNTRYAVIKTSSNVTTTQHIMGSVVDTNRNDLSIEAEKVALYAGAGLYSPAIVTANTLAIIKGIVNGATSKIEYYRFDGYMSSTTGNTGNHTQDGITLLARYTATAPFLGKAARFLLYSGIVSDADDAKIKAYLERKYGFSATADHEYFGAGQQSSTEQGAAGLSQTYVLAAIGQDSSTEQAQGSLTQKHSLIASGQDSTSEQASASMAQGHQFAVSAQESATQQATALMELGGVFFDGIAQESLSEQATSLLAVHLSFAAAGQASLSEQQAASFPYLHHIAVAAFQVPSQPKRFALRGNPKEFRV